jgi:hypothetical protein
VKGISQVFKGNSSTFWDEEIEQVTEGEADDMYNAQGNETGEEGEEYNPPIFEKLDELAFFLRFFFIWPL